jgi:hypothetical protein
MRTDIVPDIIGSLSKLPLDGSPFDNEKAGSLLACRFPKRLRGISLTGGTPRPGSKWPHSESRTLSCRSPTDTRGEKSAAGRAVQVIYFFWKAQSLA